MNFRTQIKMLFIAVVITLLPTQNSFAVTMQIDTAQSIVHTTNWSNWQWSSWGAPDDGVDIAIAGVFDLAIESGVINAFTNVQSPNRILFANINVPTSGIDGRTWQFPTFEGFFNDYVSASFSGSEDWCSSFGYYFGGGSCWSAGDFGSFSGIWDGSTLILSGNKNPDLFAGSNGFSYTIVATVVPLPSTVWLLGAGLIGLVGATRKRKIT